MPVCVEILYFVMQFDNGVSTDFENEFTYRKFLEQGREPEFDRLFDDAVAKAKKELGKRFPMFINGKEAFAREELKELSPIDGTHIGNFQKGTRDDATDAISAAGAVFREWSSTDYKERAGIFRKAARLLSQRKFEMAA